MRLARTYDITYGISKAPVTMTQVRISIQTWRDLMLSNRTCS